MTTGKRRSDQAGRAKLTSLGRPPTARCEHVRHFRALIAEGLSSEAAVVQAGMSPPVGAEPEIPCGRRQPTVYGQWGDKFALGKFASANFPDSKSDMMTCFMDRAGILVKNLDFWAMINDSIVDVPVLL